MSNQTQTTSQNTDSGSLLAQVKLDDPLGSREHWLGKMKRLEEQVGRERFARLMLSREVAPPRTQRELQTARERGAMELAAKVRSLGTMCTPDPKLTMHEIRQAQDRKREALKVSGVDERYMHADLEQVPNWLPVGYHALAADLIRLIASPGTMAVYGAVGTGKTFLMCGAVRWFIENGLRAWRHNTAQVLKNLYQAQFEKADVDRRVTALMRNYTALPLLILDDVQARSLSRFVDEADFEELIDARYRALRATVLVSQHVEEKDIRESLGVRVWRRVIETGGVRECKWPRIETLRPRVE